MRNAVFEVEPNRGGRTHDTLQYVREESVGMTELSHQLGGDHYRKMAIQPIEYILANDLGFVEGAVVKYVSRWKEKGGIEDLEKALHLLKMLIEHDRALPND